MGREKCDTEEECLLRVERCSPWGAPQEMDGESREEPEEHKRNKEFLEIVGNGSPTGSVCERRQLQFPPRYQ